MKRIIICAAQVPFERGGAEALVEGLRRNLLSRGHSVDVVSLPFKWYPPARLLSSALSWRMLDLHEVNGQAVDMVIATKFPSYVVEHPHKVTWLVHQFRQAYDWYGTPLSDLSTSDEDVELRQSICGDGPSHTCSSRTGSLPFHATSPIVCSASTGSRPRRCTRLRSTQTACVPMATMTWSPTLAGWTRRSGSTC